MLALVLAVTAACGADPGGAPVTPGPTSAAGAWARTGDTWAPEAIEVAPDRFVLYYTARSTSTERQCIGRAVAGSPRGPFRDPHPEPLVCQADAGGSLYLYWSGVPAERGAFSWGATTATPSARRPTCTASGSARTVCR